MSKKGQTNRQVAEVIFGKAEATKILSTSLTKSELSDAEFTEEDKADDVSIKSFVDNFFDRTTVVIIEPSQKAKKQPQLARAAK